MVPGRSRSRRFRAGALLLSLLALGGLVGCTWGGAAAAPLETARVVIHFLDVGQGDAVLIEAPEGRRILIDAGPDGRVLDHLRRLGVDTLDLLIASHNHADHIGGAAEVVRAVPVRFFMDNGVPHTTRTYERMLDALLERDVPLLEPERRTLTLGPLELRILPPPGEPGLGHNDNSVGVVLRFGEFGASFAGDAEAHLWHHWIERDPAMLTGVEVHKASHHGSRNGDIAEALVLLAPELVVVSAGTGNPYGHPHPDALALYQEAGASVLVTADQGTVTVVAAPDGTFEVRAPEAAPAQGPDPSHLPRLPNDLVEPEHGPPVPGGHGGAHHPVERPG